MIYISALILSLNCLALTMTHTGINTFEELTGHDKGWDEHLLRLRMMLS